MRGRAEAERRRVAPPDELSALDRALGLQAVRGREIGGERADAVLEAREGLLCAGSEVVVGTSDGAKFTGSPIKAIAALIDPRPPLWT